MKLEHIKVGDLVLIEAKDGAMIFDVAVENNAATIVEIRRDSMYKYRCDFGVTKNVLVYEEEIIKILSKTENPEYFL